MGYLDRTTRVRVTPAQRRAMAAASNDMDLRAKRLDAARPTHAGELGAKADRYIAELRAHAKALRELADATAQAAYNDEYPHGRRLRRAKRVSSVRA